MSTGGWSERLRGRRRVRQALRSRPGRFHLQQLLQQLSLSRAAETGPTLFPQGQGSIKRRIGYALAQEFVAHTDRGGRSFNFANVLGAVSAGGISNLYYPNSDRGFTLTMSRAGIALIYGSAGGLMDEFWPDINRKLFHKQPKTALLSQH